MQTWLREHCVPCYTFNTFSDANGWMSSHGPTLYSNRRLKICFLIVYLFVFHSCGKKECFSSEFSSLSFPNEISDQRQDQASASGGQTNISVPPPDPRPFLNWPSERSDDWTSSGPEVALTSLAWARPQGRPLRVRRHTHSRGSHGHHQNQLIRMGCMLGTCQVQNLSHRLYQLIGQSGREDSPMNPQSPHSYGWIRWPLQTPTVCLSIIYLSLYVLLVVIAFSFM